ncbi:hypothetical protein M569_16903, partial [Genlisea aurea]
GFQSGQGTAGISREPNKEILEHDRKRRIELKLLVLEEKLIDQGYTDAEIAEKLDEARKSLDEESGIVGIFMFAILTYMMGVQGFGDTDSSNSCSEGKADGKAQSCSWHRIGIRS